MEWSRGFGILNDHRTVEVRWEDYVLTTFSQDVRERSVALDNTEPDLGKPSPVNTVVSTQIVRLN